MRSDQTLDFQALDDEPDSLARQPGVACQLNDAEGRAIGHHGAQHTDVATVAQQAGKRETKVTLRSGATHTRNRFVSRLGY